MATRLNEINKNIEDIQAAIKKNEEDEHNINNISLINGETINKYKSLENERDKLISVISNLLKLS